MTDPFKPRDGWELHRATGTGDRPRWGGVFVICQRADRMPRYLGGFVADAPTTAYVRVVVDADARVARVLTVDGRCVLGEVHVMRGMLELGRRASAWKRGEQSWMSYLRRHAAGAVRAVLARPDAIAAARLASMPWRAQVDGTFPGDLERTDTGHTRHCDARREWGDGECECGLIPPLE